MLCENCGRCVDIQLKDNTMKIGCLEKGTFNMSLDWEDNFNCDDYQERKEEVKKEKHKPNISVILKQSGRDISFYSPSTKSADEIEQLMACGFQAYRFENFIISADDVSVIAYIGDE